jgi:hypothetical protein
VKERIYKYLLEAGRGVSATRILSDVLNVRSPNANSSNSVLAGFLGQDPRFVFTDGLWHLSSLSKEPIRFDFAQAVVLHLRSPNRYETLQGLRGTIRSSPLSHLSISLEGFALRSRAICWSCGVAGSFDYGTNCCDQETWRLGEETICICET